MKDLKINFLDTFVSSLLILFSLIFVFCLGLLQVIQAIWEKRTLEKTVSDRVSRANKNTWYTIRKLP